MNVLTLTQFETWSIVLQNSKYYCYQAWDILKYEFIPFLRFIFDQKILY